MIDKTDEQLNQWITENVMKGCWHENVTDAVFEIDGSYVEVSYWCPKCGIAVDKLYDTAGDSYGFNSTYCADLNAVARAEAKVIEAKGLDGYSNALWHVLEMGIGFYARNTAVALGARSTARQRAEAIYLAMGGSDDR